MTDNYPLMDTSACYSLQAWWLSGDSTMYKNDMSKSIDSVTINSGSSNIWIDSQAPSSDIVCSNNRWTGQIIFTAPPSSDANFKVEIGYWDGANFTAGGPNTTINGNGSDSVFIFQTNSEAFTIDPGNKLAFKITNNSSASYNVQTGGGYSYCSSSLSNPEYMPDIYHVATNGSNTAPYDIWAKATTSIQTAIDAANNGDIIIVGSSGTGHGTGVYTENVNVTKSLTIKSVNGYATTTVHGSVTSDHVFEVQANNVTIGGEGCGFSIYGATNEGRAGVYLSGRTGCTIKDNRCGWDSDHKSYYGICLISSGNNTLTGNTCGENGEGIWVESSSNNTLTGNTCNSNQYFGIYLESSSNNTLTANICNSNSCGIPLSSSSNNILSGNTCDSNSGFGIGMVSSSNNNTLTGNTCNSNFDGIYLSSSSNNNTLMGNTCNSNYYDGILLYVSSNNNTLTGNTVNENSNYGILLSSSNNNTIYLNNLSNNTNGDAYVEVGNCTGNTWHSPTPIYYDYAGGSFHKNYLGNYYGNYTGSDPDGDGIGNSAYSVNDMNVDYPLMDTSACYLLQAWWLSGDSTMYKNDMSKSIDSVTLNSGSSNIWIADQATLIDINIPGTDSWTGQIVFTSAPANGETFTAEFGSSTNGSDFIAGGPDATISGKDTVTVFTFETDSRAFTVSAGSYLALRITNNSSKNYAVKTGGAWSYCSSPYSSYNYLVSVDNNSMNENVPKEYALHQNYPNPFNPVTTISYDLAEDVYVELTVYNIIGEKVTTLVKGNQPAGYYNIEWDGRNSRGLIVSSGMYLLRINAGNYCKTNKMVFVR
jgi:parallel beta-helix repeat protein